MQPYYIALIVIAAVLLILFSFAALCEFAAFGRRHDKNPLLKYFSADDFGLSARNVVLPHGLKGYLYEKPETERKDEIIIFCHGMGPGHIAYTTEIAFFCNNGYRVLAVDNKGCNLSAGKTVGGMYSGVRTAVRAVDYVRADKELSGSKIWLVGHSWGAYSALCASAQRKVDGVVAVSAPNTPAKAIQQASSATLSKPVSMLLRPFWWLTNLLRYGVRGNSSAARCAVRSRVPVLLVHGESDGVVPPHTAAIRHADGSNITKLSVAGKAHNPYNTENAEKLLSELMTKMRKGVKDFSDFDFVAATEEDKAVMAEIARFISEN